MNAKLNTAKQAIANIGHDRYPSLTANAARTINITPTSNTSGVRFRLMP